MSKLDKKVALVTGASKGIGAGIARELAAAGAAVVVNFAIDGERAEALVEQIKLENGQAVAVQADVSHAADVSRLFQDVASTFGRLDILVNNAGVYRETPIEELTEEEFHRQFNINVLGPLLVIRESLQYFGSEGGTIINIGSGASKMCPPGYSIYSASKSALDAITGVLSKELASRNIRVNSVNPGATLSEGTQAAGLYGVENDFEKQLVAMTPLNRIGTPADIARVVAFLASDDSAWLTGEIIQASGGLR
ncbi:SDR family NAD(P)-dependent oxidoreductase [Gimesia maris]|uniref:3-oxoacyl-[acyl-carrier-protein] reductase FabG n=1 Tax=Gimesia maris TaxID=122 RepID=A0ABX5YEU1_9PLAN|nr:glucose 1-dehydrogenase [Gimesia maris]EDL60889.1 putative short-chain dehydrogenase [Gimesia maris DSM 8797]QEG14187.1 3-oxoacyl-[acyl-carrier-protein] reductase FabG [Gimesia maris]QGQ32362.1 glucose 1-dehydrogenase [Gimesia maris]